MYRALLGLFSRAAAILLLGSAMLATTSAGAIGGGSVAAQAKASALGQSATAAAPRMTGRWLRPVAQELGVCKGGAAAWGWNYGGGRDLRRIDAAGHTVHTWNLPRPIRQIRFSRDCRVVWVITNDWTSLYVVNAGIYAEPVGLRSPLPQPIETLTVSSDGQLAWLEFTHHPRLLLARYQPAAIAIVELPHYPQDLYIDDSEAASAGTSLWVTPKSPGLLLVGGTTGYRSYPQLAKVDVSFVMSAYPAKLGWVVPGIDLLGFYVVDTDMRTAGPFLADREVQNISVLGDFAWVMTADNEVYVYRGRAGPGGPAVDPVPAKGGPVAMTGASLAAGDVYLVGDGSHAWLKSVGRHDAYTLGSYLWHAHVVDDAVEASLLDPRCHDNKPIRALFLDSLDPDHIWLQTYDFSIYEARINSTVPNLTDLPSRVDSLVPAANGRLWLTQSSLAGFLSGPGSDLHQVTLSIGADTLTSAPAKPASLRGAFGTTTAQVELQGPAAFMAGGPDEAQEIGPMIQRDVHPRATIDLALLQRPKGQEVKIAEGSRDLEPKGRTSLPLLARESVDYSVPVEVRLTYADTWGSSVVCTWRNVTLATSLWSRIASNPLGRATVILLVPILVLCLALHHDFLLRQWSPVLVTSADALWAHLQPDLLKLTWLDVLIAAALVGVATLLLALTSPAAFRAIARLEPFARAVPYVMRLSRIRRLLYKDFLVQLSEQIDQRREKATNEHYVPIQVRLLDVCGSLGLAGGEVMNAERLAFILSSQPEPSATRGADVLVEGPGGRGKSALLHELVCQAIESFRTTNGAPLPVIGDPEKETVEEMILAGLGPYSLSTEYTRAAIASGDFVLFVDGLSEAGRRASILDRYFFGERRQLSRVCVTTRPSPALRDSFAKSERWLVVEPSRLDDANVDEFIRSYATADARAKLRSDGTTDLEAEKRKIEEHAAAVLERTKAIVAILRSTEGTYLPLLVRFGMLLDADVDTVADVLDATVKRLLKPCAPDAATRDQLYRDLSELAYSSYFVDSKRTIVASHYAKFQASFETWSAAGLLTPDKGLALLTGQPSRFQFLHDSLQSYLAAHWLAANDRWDDLFAAAGDPVFARAASDLSGEQRSELFSMCLLTFEPVATMRQYMADGLSAWCNRLFRLFSLDDVLGGLAPDIVKELGHDSGHISPKALLGLALELAVKRDAAQDSCDRVAKLYARLAPLVWPLRQKLADQLARAS